MIHQYGFGPLRRAIPIAAGELSEGRIGAGHHVGRPQRMRLPCAKPIAEREGLTERRVARLIDIASCRRVLGRGHPRQSSAGRHARGDADAVAAPVAWLDPLHSGQSKSLIRADAADVLPADVAAG
jgi:hypothetical protein